MIGGPLGGWLAAGALAGVLAAGASGWWLGARAGEARAEARHAAARAALERRLVAVSDRLSEASAVIEAERRDRARLIREIEDEIRADSDPCRAPSAGSLQRLDRRWGAD